jgi:hypothetical protein
MSVADRLEQVCFLLNVEMAGEDGAPPSVSSFDAYVEAHVNPFLAACLALENKDLKKVHDQTKLAMDSTRNFLYAATSCKKPEPEAMMAFVAPISGVIQKAGLLPRKTKVLEHLRAFEQAVQCCGWILMTGGAAHVTGQKEAAMLYLNKVLMYARDLTDEDLKAKHRAFVNTLKAMLTELAEYVTSYHKQGIVWKFGGESLTDFKVPEAGGGGSKKSEADRVEDCVAALQAYAAKMAGGDGQDGAPPAVAAWQAVLETELKAFLEVCSREELGLDAKGIATWAKDAFMDCGRVIEHAHNCAKPSDEKFGELLGPISACIGACSEPNRRDKTFDYIKGFNEVLTGLAWLCPPNGPDYVQNQVDAAGLYTNKILRQARDAEGAKATAMKDYVKTLKALGMAVKEYVKEWYKMGFVFRGKGTDFAASVHFPVA